MTLCLLASHVALAVWTGLAYRNLFALGVGDLRFAPGWGVWAWFVPFLNFVRPKQIVDDVTTVDVVSCDDPHAYELIDVVAHDAPPGATYPGQERLFQFGAEQCVEHFEEIVGTPFMRSDLDVFMYVPTDFSWRLGDRDIQCMALRVDGGALEGTVVGSGL